MTHIPLGVWLAAGFVASVVVVWAIGTDLTAVFSGALVAAVFCWGTAWLRLQEQR